MHPQKLFLREDDKWHVTPSWEESYNFFFWIEKIILLVRDYFMSKWNEEARRILYGSEGQVLRSLQ